MFGFTVFGLLTGATLEVANRAALTALDAADIPAGTTFNVLDIGDGSAEKYTLQLDARAANGKLRITALNRAGYLWVAGDGVKLRRTYQSALVDVFTIGNYLLVPAFSSAGWFFTVLSGARFVVSQLSGAITTVPTAIQMHAGNNTAAGKDNMGPTSWPSAALLNAVIGAAIGPPYDFYTGPVTSLVYGPNDLTDAGRVYVDVAATGVAATYKGYFIIDGNLSASDIYP